MKIQITAPQGLLDPAGTEFVERRLLFALSRFAPRIGTIHVKLEAANGPKAERETRCAIDVILRGGKSIVVHDQDSCLVACVTTATARAGRVVARAVERSGIAPRVRASKG